MSKSFSLYTPDPNDTMDESHEDVPTWDWVPSVSDWVSPSGWERSTSFPRTHGRRRGKDRSKECVWVLYEVPSFISLLQKRDVHSIKKKLVWLSVNRVLSPRLTRVSVRKDTKKEIFPDPVNVIILYEQLNFTCFNPCISSKNCSYLLLSHLRTTNTMFLLV